MDLRPVPLMVTDFRLEHPANAPSGIDVTVAGIVTRTARDLPANVLAVNDVTGLPPNVSGITRLVVSKETPVTCPSEYSHALPEASVHVSAQAVMEHSIAAPIDITDVNDFFIRCSIFIFHSIVFTTKITAYACIGRILPSF